MKQVISTSELENRMRPGAYSCVGFLGAAESLKEVLRKDKLALREAGISIAQISEKLETLLEAVLEQRNSLLLSNYQEYSEREYRAIKWHSQPAPKFSLENLPDLKIGYIVESKYQVFIVQYRGFQECPWSCKVDHSWASFDLLLLNRETAKYITAPGLIAHLIREHHFFEGPESPYRVDPIKLAQVLERA
jgi:hypothetical protein